MSVFDRFRKLESARPDRPAPPRPTDDSVSGRFGKPEIPPDPADGAPLNCAKCGGDSPARSARCFNCDADLDTREMRAHQIEHRARHVQEKERAEGLREARKKEALAKAELELEKHRTRRADQQQQASDSEVNLWPSRMPIGWLLRSTRSIQDPGLRLGVQVAIVVAFIGLIAWGVSSPSRYGFLIVAGLLLGGGGWGRRGYYRRRRWWW